MIACNFNDRPACSDKIDVSFLLQLITIANSFGPSASRASKVFPYARLDRRRIAWKPEFTQGIIDKKHDQLMSKKLILKCLRDYMQDTNIYLYLVSLMRFVNLHK